MYPTNEASEKRETSANAVLLVTDPRAAKMTKDSGVPKEEIFYWILSKCTITGA